MFYKMIEAKRNEWLASNDCTVKGDIAYMPMTLHSRISGLLWKWSSPAITIRRSAMSDLSISIWRILWQMRNVSDKHMRKSADFLRRDK